LGAEAISATAPESATPAMSDDTLLPFAFPAVARRRAGQSGETRRDMGLDF
jgi:hypothetical protein